MFGKFFLGRSSSSSSLFLLSPPIHDHCPIFFACYALSYMHASVDRSKLNWGCLHIQHEPPISFSVAAAAAIPYVLLILPVPCSTTHHFMFPEIVTTIYSTTTNVLLPAWTPNALLLPTRRCPFRSRPQPKTTPKIDTMGSLAGWLATPFVQPRIGRRLRQLVTAHGITSRAGRGKNSSVALWVSELC